MADLYSFCFLPIKHDIRHYVEETAIQQMIALMHQYKRGLEQEALILG